MDLENRIIKITNTGLQPIHNTVITDVKTGETIPNIIRIKLDLNIKNGDAPLSALVIQRHNLLWSKQLTTVNPQVDIDVQIAEVQREHSEEEIWSVLSNLMEMTDRRGIDLVVLSDALEELMLLRARVQQEVTL